MDRLETVTQKTHKTLKTEFTGKPYLFGFSLVLSSKWVRLKSMAFNRPTLKGEAWRVLANAARLYPVRATSYNYWKMETQLTTDNIVFSGVFYT
jgi:hypothetical protein